MQYFYFKKSQDNLYDAQEKYPWLFELDMIDESREVRYRILEYLSNEYGYTGRIENTKHGGICPVSIAPDIVLYFSISHTRNYVGFSVSDDRVGFDIAEYAIRDTSLLSIHDSADYNLLDGENWNNFYTLWTAKEAIIKLIDAKLDDMYSIKLISGTDGVFIFGFQEKKYIIQHVSNDSIFISYASHYEPI